MSPALVISLRLGSPGSSLSGMKRQPRRQSPTSGTSRMNTARMPFILASKIWESHCPVPGCPRSQLPRFTWSRIDDGRSTGNADFVTALWIAVDKAMPTTDPSIRIKFRVEVATARSSGLDNACNATRAIHRLFIEHTICSATRQTDQAEGQSRCRLLR